MPLDLFLARKLKYTGTQIRVLLRSGPSYVCQFLLNFLLTVIPVGGIGYWFQHDLSYYYYLLLYLCTSISTQFLC